MSPHMAYSLFIFSEVEAAFLHPTVHVCWTWRDMAIPQGLLGNHGEHFQIDSVEPKQKAV